MAYAISAWTKSKNVISINAIFGMNALTVKKKKKRRKPMKERTESILLSIASAIMIAVVVMCIITNLRLTNLNERLDREKLQRMANQAATQTLIEMIDRKVEHKLDKPEPIEEINTEDLTLPKHNYPYRNEYQKEEKTNERQN